MYNKIKCRTCRYRGHMSGGSDMQIYCDVVGKLDQTNLHIENGEVRDYRGEDPENCLMYSYSERLWSNAMARCRAGIRNGRNVKYFEKCKKYLEELKKKYGKM